MALICAGVRSRDVLHKEVLHAEAQYQKTHGEAQEGKLACFAGCRRCQQEFTPDGASDGQLPHKVLKLLAAKEHVEELAAVHEAGMVIQPLRPVAVIQISELGVTQDLDRDRRKRKHMQAHTVRP